MSNVHQGQSLEKTNAVDIVDLVCFFEWPVDECYNFGNISVVYEYVTIIVKMLYNLLLIKTLSKILQDCWKVLNWKF